jgi:hypothetical protein
MNPAHDYANLTITEDNRHQYLETAIANISEADREIRQAEARGVARRAREEELKQTLKRSAWIALACVVAGVGYLVFKR